MAVQRLLDAGAVIFGKTNVPVALADWQSFNPVYGTTNNPGTWGARRAVPPAARRRRWRPASTALELGSDIGASIRNPAHYCGVYGHKPTWGVVPMEGHQLPGDVCIDSLDIAVAGPLARAMTWRWRWTSGHPLQAFGPLGWNPVAWRDPARRRRGCAWRWSPTTLR